MEYLLGIDVGTSSAKAVLMDASGKPVHAVAPEYAFSTPKPNWAESDPSDWWEATVSAIRSVLEVVSADAIAGVGLTGQMHGLVLLDRDGSVLRPCIMWNDQRTAAECGALTRAIGAERVLQLTGNPLLPGFTAPKVVWVRENEPEVYARIARILLPKDYVRYRLSGAYCTDVSDASGMALLDVANRTWSEEMLAGAEIPLAWLPELTESPVASARVSEEGARATGLLAGTPIAAGGGDQAAQAVGCGIVREGVISATLGTSGVIFAHSDSYRVEPEGRLHAFCHAVPGKWHLMGVMLSAAGSYQWYRNTLGGGAGYPELDAEAARAPAGAEGLFFLPYLSGERMPHPDPDARGAFIGLSLRHGREHMTRAVLEGVCYGMRDGLELMRALGLRSKEIIASGGGARSPLWRQMLADTFETCVVTVNATEGAAYGAAVLAGVAAGVYDSVEEACATTVRTTGDTDPGADAAVYRTLYPHYRALYPALRDVFREIAGTVESSV